jgi:plastocyanin
MRRAATLAIVAACAGAVLVTSADGATTLKLKAAASGANKYDKTRLTAAPGKVTIRLKNPGSSGKPHAVEIVGKGVDKASGTAGPGQRVSVTARLAKGTYQFFCPIDGHRAAGMKGTLVER